MTAQALQVLLSQAREQTALFQGLTEQARLTGLVAGVDR